jgi:serine/threonine protein kinase
MRAPIERTYFSVMNIPSSSQLRAEAGTHRLRVGAILQDRYRITRELGAGGMGAVYEAVDQRLETTVALKETLSTDDRLRRQFEQEARLLAHLHHPCLPRVSDYFSESGRAFLVMQFISGPDLAQILLQRPAPFPRNQVIAWADQLLDALMYLHERDRQIIHRDIKPHNLKLMPNGHVALLDFGLAKTHAADQSTTNSSNSIFGYTRRYSPPEQIRDLGTTPQSDIYALGATLYHLLTGVKPPDSLKRAAAVANSEPDPLALMLAKGVDSELSVVLDRAMALHARDRFKSAKEFREALGCVGRKSSEAVEAANVLTAAQANLSSVKKQNLAVDPFDSYSILKPDLGVFTIPRKGRGPAIFAVAAAILLVLLVVALPARVVNSFGRMLDASNGTSTQPLTDAAVIRQNKSDTTGQKSPQNKNSSFSSERQFLRKEGSAKHRAPQSSEAKPVNVKPPRFSISPE